MRRIEIRIQGVESGLIDKQNGMFYFFRGSYLLSNKMGIIVPLTHYLASEISSP